jgi:hypothetical protein
LGHGINKKMELRYFNGSLQAANKEHPVIKKYSREIHVPAQTTPARCHPRDPLSGEMNRTQAERKLLHAAPRWTNSARTPRVHA